jgi:diguanylate cyclase (GGDEF)-like protein/PAS domain S-box-containing protein
VAGHVRQLSHVTVVSPDDPPLEALQQALLDYATEFLVFVDREGDIVIGAGDGMHILGYDATEQQGEKIVANVHPDDLPAVFDLVKRARRTPDLDEAVTARARRKEGGWVLLEAHVMTVVDQPPLGTGAIVRIRQIGDVESTAPSVVVVDDERFASLTASLPTGVLTVDAEGGVRDANDAALSLLRRTLADLEHGGWMQTIHPEDRAEVDDALRLIDQGASQAEAVVRADVDGRVRWIHVTLVALGVGRRDGWLVAFDDVTERHRATADLAHRATHDALTGLPNRTLLEDRLEQACARLGSPGRSVALLFGDLDRFKEINDEFGHQAGDEVLRQVAARLVRSVRATDTVTRLGGDEFVVVCEDLPAAESAELAERITAVVREPIDAGDERLCVTISVGIVATDVRGSDPTELLARADDEMYRRKRRGE